MNERLVSPLLIKPQNFEDKIMSRKEAQKTQNQNFSATTRSP